MVCDQYDQGWNHIFRKKTKETIVYKKMAII